MDVSNTKSDMRLALIINGNHTHTKKLAEVWGI